MNDKQINEQIIRCRDTEFSYFKLKLIPDEKYQENVKNIAQENVKCQKMIKEKIKSLTESAFKPSLDMSLKRLEAEYIFINSGDQDKVSDYVKKISQIVELRNSELETWQNFTDSQQKSSYNINVFSFLILILTAGFIIGALKKYVKDKV